MGCFSMPKGLPNKRYTPEFQRLAVETMQKEKLSYREAAGQLEINDHKRISAWEGRSGENCAEPAESGLPCGQAESEMGYRCDGILLIWQKTVPVTDPRSAQR